MAWKIEPLELFTKLEAFCAAHVPKGYVVNDDPERELLRFRPRLQWVVEYRWEFSFSVSARVAFSVRESRATIHLNGWHGGGLSGAAACVSLYRDVVDFAAKVECWLGQYELVAGERPDPSDWEVPAPEAKAET